MSTTEELNITLPRELVATIEEGVRSGEYASASDVVRDAMLVWQQHRDGDAGRLAAIRARIRRSLDDPRPDLDDEAVSERLDALHARTLAARPSRR